MSTDGTQPPPSIAPKKPVGGPSVRTADASPWVPTTNATAGSPATSRIPSPSTGDAGPARGASAGPSTGTGTSTGTGAGTGKGAGTGAGPSTGKGTSTGVGTESTPSVAERIKRAAQNVAGAAKTAVTERDGGRGTDLGTDRRSETSQAQRDAARAGGAPRPARKPAPATAPAPAAGPRRVRLAVARIDPWSVMKLGFLLSVAVGIMIVVASAVVWYTLDSLAVFTEVNDVIATLSGSTTFFDVLEYASFERVISLATMIAVVDVILLTALSTIGAFLYNIVAALVGGIHLTLTDD